MNAQESKQEEMNLIQSVRNRSKVAALWQAGAHLAVQGGDDAKEETKFSDLSPLSLAVRAQRNDIAKVLIEHGAKPDVLRWR